MALEDEKPPLTHTLGVAGVESEHRNSDELDQRSQEPEAEDVVEELEEVFLLERVSLQCTSNSIRGGAVLVCSDQLVSLRIILVTLVRFESLCFASKRSTQPSLP